MAAANSALITRQPDASGPATPSALRSMTIGSATRRGEVDVAGDRVGDALPGQRPAEFGAVDRIAEEAVTPGFAAGRFLPGDRARRRNPWLST
jgi:hypothetical protein